MVYWLIDLSIFRNKVYLQKFLAHFNDKVVTKGVNNPKYLKTTHGQTMELLSMIHSHSHFI